jgi:hypothetical protein
VTILAQLPKCYDTIVDAFRETSRELKTAGDELYNAQSELTALNGPNLLNYIELLLIFNTLL